MVVFFIILTVACFFISVSLHKSTNEHEAKFNNCPSKINSPSNDLFKNQKYAIINILAFTIGTNSISAYSDEANMILNQWCLKLGLSKDEMEKSIQHSMKFTPERSIKIIIDSMIEIKDKDFIRTVYHDVKRIAQISGDKDTIELINDLFNDILTH